jgi:hypothetical protein
LCYLYRRRARLLTDSNVVVVKDIKTTSLSQKQMYAYISQLSSLPLLVTLLLQGAPPHWRQGGGCEGDQDLLMLTFLCFLHRCCCCRARRLTDGKVVVVKEIKTTSLSQKQKAATMDEVEVLAKFNHPNIVK